MSLFFFLRGRAWRFFLSWSLVNLFFEFFDRFTWTVMYLVGHEYLLILFDTECLLSLDCDYRLQNLQTLRLFQNLLFIYRDQRVIERGDVFFWLFFLDVVVGWCGWIELYTNVHVYFFRCCQDLLFWVSNVDANLLLLLTYFLITIFNNALDLLGLTNWLELS